MHEGKDTRYDLNALIREPAATKLDSSTILHITSDSPFVSIPGTFNAREIGAPLPPSLRVNEVSVPDIGIRRGYAFRTGSLEDLAEEGKEAIRKLGIKVVFDLRSTKEREKHPDPNIPNTRNVWHDSMHANQNQETHDSQMRQSQTSGGGQAEDSFADFFTDMYVQMLETHQPGIRSVFEHIVHHADQPFLIHCTAGKDRTGLVAALVLAIANAPIEYINLEYALSRIGIDEDRPMLITKMTGRDMPVSELTGNQRLYAEVKLDAMTPMLEHIHHEYEGIDGYLQTKLGFSPNDVEAIRANLMPQSVGLTLDTTT